MPPPPPPSDYWKQRAAQGGASATSSGGAVPKTDYSDLDYRQMDFSYSTETVARYGGQIVMGQTKPQ